MILYILIGVIILDCFFSLYRIYRRINLYNQAYEKSKSSNKELLVIGNPYFIQGLLIKIFINAMIVVISV